MKTKHLIAGIVMLTVSAISTQAGLLASNVVGATVVYTEITEDIQGYGTGSFGGTYGVPSSSGGDGVDFTPSGLHSYSAAGQTMTTDARLTFCVEALDGFHITELDFSESGDAALTGAGLKNGDVYATFFVDVLEIDGGAPDAIVNGNKNPPAYGSYTSSGVYTWSSGIETLDIQSIVANSGASYEFGATKVKITLDNFMITAAEDVFGTSALINKKDTDGFTVTAISIPEPASAALMVGIAGIAVFVRRRFIG